MSLPLRDIHCAACQELMRDTDAFVSCGQHGTFEPLPGRVVRIWDEGVVTVEVVE